MGGLNEEEPLEFNCLKKGGRRLERLEIFGLKGWETWLMKKKKKRRFARVLALSLGMKFHKKNQIEPN